jgi:hypothetical protein
VKDNYVHCTDWDQFNSLEELNESFNIYLNKEYQSNVHSTTKMTPRERYKKDLNLIKYKPTEELEKAFLNRLLEKYEAMLLLVFIQYILKCHKDI